MRAIILAAGRGSRMGNLTDERPKCLVEFRGRSLLDGQLAAIRAAGVDEIAIVTGYRRDLLANRVSVEFHNPRWAQTNMFASLGCAGEWLQAGPCVVSYADLFYEPAAVALLASTSAPLAITYDPDWLELWSRRFADPLSDAETFRVDAQGVLQDIGGQAAHADDIQGQYMGLLRIAPEAWGEMQNLAQALAPHERDALHMTGLLQKVIRAGQVPVRALAYRGQWGEIDSPSDLAAYQG